MCGIWFSVGIAPDRSCLDVIAHRGPDGEGWREFDSPAGPVALGHRRLAIIDTSDGGLQPMSYGDERYWVVFNGEIYNYRELRKELISKEIAFASRSDTEVLLAAYAVWGEACLDRLRGMFAFVIYDRAQQTFFAARDRFGIKPLYWALTGQGIAFGSEIKQLLQVPDVSRRGNIARLYDFLSSGISNHTGETMFADVRQLRAGHCLTLDLNKLMGLRADLTIHRWYQLPRPGSIRPSAGEAAERFRELLADSVRLHMRSDVLVGSCLSGGLDSSAIVSLAVRQLRRDGAGSNFNTVSACYDEKRVDERLFMDAVVAASRTTPHYVYPRVEDSLTQAEKITWHQDEPYGSTSIFAQWCVFEEARRAGIKVMLDGQGADEQLAGYHSAFGYHSMGLLRQGRLVALAQVMLERRRDFGVPLHRQLKSLIGPLLPTGMYSALRRGHSRYYEADWLDSEAFCSLNDGNSSFRETLAREGITISGIGDLCVAMVQATNLPTLLHWEDRNSMAHGIEARVPFLDHPLVEFDIGLGDWHKMVGTETKSVLRRAMRGVMPDRICDRQDKLGFATPEEEWFRGPLREAVEGGIEDTLARFPTLLNANSTRQLTQDCLSGRQPFDFALWRIINLGIWGRVFGVTL